MTWKDELPRPETTGQSLDTVGVRVCQFLTYSFVVVAAFWAAFIVWVLYSLARETNCTLAELFRVAWLEFVYGPLWPLLGAGVVFVVWRYLSSAGHA